MGESESEANALSTQQWCCLGSSTQRPTPRLRTKPDCWRLPWQPAQLDADRASCHSSDGMSRCAAVKACVRTRGDQPAASHVPRGLSSRLEDGGTVNQIHSIARAPIGRTHSARARAWVLGHPERSRRLHTSESCSARTDSRDTRPANKAQQK